MIQLDARWQRGFVDRWRTGVKQAVQAGVSGARDAADPCDVIIAWSSTRAHRLGGASKVLNSVGTGPHENAIVTGEMYASRDIGDGVPLVVILDGRPDELQLDAVARRFNATPSEQRPLLSCAYLSDGGAPNFLAHGIPRPIPILPLLIRAGIYQHKPGTAHPTSAEFALPLASAVEKATDH